MPKVYTRRGDAGETGLLFGGRVAKDDPRCEAYGTVDSALSAMGLARALCRDPWVKGVLLDVQRDMFVVGSELATDPADHARLEATFAVVTADMVTKLEELIDRVNAQIDLPSAFIVPGGLRGVRSARSRAHAGAGERAPSRVAERRTGGARSPGAAISQPAVGPSLHAGPVRGQGPAGRALVRGGTGPVTPARDR